jgi:hypothetical protein
MQVDGRFKYHIKLIPRRWYKEHLQDSVDLEETFGPFLYATTQNTEASEGQTADAPDAAYMSDMFKVFPLGSSLSQDDKSRLSKRRRHGEISGRMKEIFDAVDSNPEVFEMVKDGLDQVIMKGRGHDGMVDPTPVKTKGRPPKRLKSSVELSARSAKHGTCKEPDRDASKQHSRRGC